MGVVYKLKQEVIDFILDQKHRNPKLSCRKLASLTSEVFQLDVSKSSVNNVLKTAHLSNPVGRPLNFKAGAREFKIPLAKKEGIFKGVKDIPPSVPQPKPVVKFVVPSPRPKKEKQKKAKLPRPKRSVEDKIADKAVSAASTYENARPPKQDELIRSVSDNIGSIFFKATEWFLSGHSVVGEVISRHFKGMTFKDAQELANVLVYLEVFGISDPEHLTQSNSRGLHQLLGSSSSIPIEKIHVLITGLKDIQSFSLEMSKQTRKHIEMIDSISIKNTSGYNIFLDARMNTVWGKNVQTEFSLPCYKAIDLMSKQIINNLDPLILSCAYNDEQDIDTFYELVAAFEQIDDKGLAEIALVNHEHGTLASFQEIPHLRRTFIAGFWPWSSDFVRFQKEANKLPLLSSTIPCVQKTIYYTQQYSHIVSQHINRPLPPMRVLILREQEKSEDLVAIATNISEEEMSSEEIIRKYILRWPNLQRGFNMKLLRDDGVKEPPRHALVDIRDEFESWQKRFQNSSSFRAVLHDYLTFLSACCQRFFFPFHYHDVSLNAMIGQVLSCPGEIKGVDGSLCVCLQPGTHHQPFREDLKEAARRVNELDIRDPQDRRLLIEVL